MNAIGNASSQAGALTLEAPSRNGTANGTANGPQTASKVQAENGPNSKTLPDNPQDVQRLVHELNALRNSQRELEAKQYIDASLAHFASVLRWDAQLGLRGWADRFLIELIPFIEGLQGALYMVNDEQVGEAAERQYLQLAGQYAAPEGIPERLELGQGITGQAAITAESVEIHEAGVFQSHINSSLSTIELKALYVQPLVHNDQVEGVLEIGALQPLPAAQLQLVRMLAETLAAQLSTIRSQVRIQKLYEEAEKTSRELVVQEEELRQNLEELESTQEEMRRVQAQVAENEERMRVVLDANPDGIVLAKADGEIVEVNRRAIEVLHAPSREALIGENPKTLSDSIEGPAPERAVEYAEIFEQTLTLGEYLVEMPHQRLDGAVFEAEVSTRTVQFKGETMVLIFLRDISSIAEQRMALREKQAVFDASRDTLLITEKGLVREVNPAGVSFFGASNKQDLKGLTVKELWHSEQPGGKSYDELIQQIGQELNEKGASLYRWNGRTLGGEKLQTEVLATRVKLGERVLVFCHVRDITDRLESEAKLQSQHEELLSSEEELRQNLEELEATQEEMSRLSMELEARNEAINQNNVLVELSPEWLIESVNGGFEKLTGYEEGAIKGKHIHSFMTEEYLASKAHQQAEQQFKDGLGFMVTKQFRHKAGEVLELETQFMPVKSRGGELERWLLVLVDKTKEKKFQEELAAQNEALAAQEEELRQNLEELEATQEEVQRMTRELEIRQKAIDSHLAVVDLDGEYNILSVNEKFEDMLGYTKQVAVGQNMVGYIDPAFLESAGFQYAVEEFSAGRGFTLKNRYVHQDGRIIDSDTTCLPVRNANNDIQHWRMLLRDITAEEQQRRELARLADELKSTDDALNRNFLILEHDLEHKVTYVNDHFLQHLGYTQKQVVGKEVFKLMDPEFLASEEMQAAKVASEKGEIFSIQDRYLTKKGMKRYMDSMLVPIRDDSGNVIKWRALIRDITDAHLADERMAQQKANLEHMFSNMLHTIQVAHWRTDLATNTYSGADDLGRLLGFEPGELSDDPDVTLPKTMAARDLAPVGKALEGLMTDPDPAAHLTLEAHGLRKDGSEVPIKLVIMKETNAAGEPIGMLGLTMLQPQASA